MLKRTGIAVFIALALLVTACGDDDGGVLTPTTADAPTTTRAAGGGERFDEFTRSAYLEGCREDGNDAFCECTLEEFETLYNQDEFERLALELDDPSQLPDEFTSVIFGCLDEFDDGGDTPPETTVVGSGGAFPQEFVDGYIEGCIPDGGRAFCECSIEAVQEVFTLEEFIGFYSELEGGEPPAELLDVLTPCLALAGE